MSYSAAEFGLTPYYTVEHRGWKFIHLNNFLWRHLGQSQRAVQHFHAVAGLRATELVRVGTQREQAFFRFSFTTR